MPPRTAVAAEALRSVRREKLMGLLPRKVCFCCETQTYTDGRLEGHLRSREASLIAAGHRCGNIGFGRDTGSAQKRENNPMHSSRQGLSGMRGERWIEGGMVGFEPKYLI